MVCIDVELATLDEVAELLHSFGDGQELSVKCVALGFGVGYFFGEKCDWFSGILY